MKWHYDLYISKGSFPYQTQWLAPWHIVETPEPKGLTKEECEDVANLATRMLRDRYLIECGFTLRPDEEAPSRDSRFVWSCPLVQIVLSKAGDGAMWGYSSPSEFYEYGWLADYIAQSAMADIKDMERVMERIAKVR